MPTSLRSVRTAFGLLVCTLFAACVDDGNVLESIEVTPAVASIAAGTSMSMTATGVLANGNRLDMTASVLWSSTAAGVADVTLGVVDGFAPGTTFIRAMDPSSGIRGAAQLTVTNAFLVSLAVTPPTPQIALGTSIQLTAMGTFSDSTLQVLTNTVTWDSSDTGIATVATGLAQSLAIGTTTITATDPGTGIADAIDLTVSQAVLTSIALTPAAPSIALGTTQQMTATGTFSDSTTQVLTTAVTWSSSDPAVATIDNSPGTEGLASSAMVGTTTLTATDVATGVDGTTILTVTAAALVSIDVTPANPSIALGTDQQFTATGTYTDSSTQDLTGAVTWSSSSGAVASISNASGTEGLASSLATGATTITATDPGSGVNGATTLTVTAAALVSIDVTPANPSIALGTNQQFTATGTYTDSSTQDLTTAVTWSSSNGTVASVSNAPGTEGLGTSLSLGSTTVSAIDPGTAVNGSTTLTVTAIALVSIAVTPVNPSIALGTDQQFTATGTYTDSSTQDLTASVTWSSSAPGAATISNAGGTEGLATSAATGATTITATDSGSGINDATTLTVTTAALVSIAVTPATPSIAFGTDQQFTATGTYTDSSTQNLTAAVTWTSSLLAVATVSNAAGTEGLAASVAPGTTTVTATEPGSGINGATVLTVTPAVLVSIAITPANPSIALGTDQQFTATGTYTDSSTQDLTISATWSSSSTGVATISNASGTEGLAASVATGSTTITATDSGSGINGSTTLTVTPAVLVSIAVTPATPSIALGTGQQFTATGTYTDSTTQDLTTTATWGSSTPATATISNAGGTEGLSASAATGTTTITATDSGSGINGSTVLTVTPATLVSIAVTPATPSIALGSDQQFTATGTYTDSSTQDLTTTATWGSSTPATATISNASGTEGLATSAATGTTTITATDSGSGINGSTVLTVTPATLVSIAVTPATPSIGLGTDQQFTATGTYSDSSTQDLTATATWGSSTPATATVSNASGTEGLATSVASGATTVTATDSGSGINGSTVLTVTPAVLVSIVVTPANLSITVGSTESFVATGTYSDSSTQDITSTVTWSSSSPSVASISNAGGSEGLASGATVGSTTITATDAGTGVNAATLLGVLVDITFVGASSVGSATLLDIDVAPPAGTAAGDVMVAAIAIRPDTATITPPAGWTLVNRFDNSGGAANSLAIYRRVAVAGEPALHRWTFSASTGSCVAIAAFRGVDVTVPVDVEAGQSTPNALTHPAPSVTTTVSGTMLVTAHAFSSAVTWTAPAGMTEAADLASFTPAAATGIALELNYELRGSAGATGVKTATAAANSDTGNAHALALSPGP